MKYDTKEFELPDTLYVRDIEPKVFISITQEVLKNIKGVSLAHGGIMDSLLGSHGISIEQDLQKKTVNIKIEVSISYGESIPAKADEIQASVSHEITRLTGLHVGAVHVVFKELFFPGRAKEEM